MNSTREGFNEGVTLATLAQERKKVVEQLENLVDNPLFRSVLYDLNVISGHESNPEIVDYFITRYDHYEGNVEDAYNLFEIAESQASLWKASYLAK